MLLYLLQTRLQERATEPLYFAAVVQAVKETPHSLVKCYPDPMKLMQQLWKKGWIC